MYRTRALLILVIAAFTFPLIAQYPLVSGDDPAPYVAKIMGGNCEDTLREHACNKAKELKDRAHKNLVEANASLDNMDASAEKANDVQTAIDSLAGIVEMFCTGEASIDPVLGPLGMLANKALEGYYEGKAARCLIAADQCLQASKEWAKLCEKCCEGRGQPNNTVVDDNPGVDFQKPIPHDELRAMLEHMTDEERKETRTQAENGTLNACDANKQTIMEVVGSDGRMR